MSPKNSLNKPLPVGDSSAPDMATISQAGLEEAGKAVEKLRDLLDKAHNGQEAAVPKIRQILDEHPDLARQFADVALIADITAAGGSPPGWRISGLFFGLTFSPPFSSLVSSESGG